LLFSCLLRKNSLICSLILKRFVLSLFRVGAGFRSTLFTLSIGKAARGSGTEPKKAKVCTVLLSILPAIYCNWLIFIGISAYQVSSATPPPPKSTVLPVGGDPPLPSIFWQGLYGVVLFLKNRGVRGVYA
jgi:hypothetical protein